MKVEGINVDYEIKELDYEAFIPIYNNFMINDFPDDELRSLHSIKRMFKDGRYSVLVMVEDERVLAYANFITDEDERVALLDYYAVTQARRGQGIGTLFLQKIRETLDVDGLLIESERPDKAETEDDRIIRTKRIDFYEQNDSVVTEYTWEAYGVIYNLLYLPIAKDVDAVDVGFKIKEMYGFTLPKALLEKYTKLYVE
ncbi:GNAT family N-acetyltransferase [Erysipelothrix rhusiopathiae]|nr:GNAT family N-acetyltransferase [Erysipelothrix sp. strain 2 (EsS2-6-Brazil)]NBA01602.1 GNAT family N-acetyltransferase [Erysipelothrix rhusiopathiae]